MSKPDAMRVTALIVMKTTFGHMQEMLNEYSQANVICHTNVYHAPNQCNSLTF